MARGTDDYDRAWIQGGTARIPARGEPFGGPLLVDDTPPEIKEHLRREERKEGSFFAADNLAGLYGRHQTALSEARKTTTLAGAKGLTERILKDYDADVLTSDEARQRFTDDALDLRQALETGAAEVEYRFQDLGRRSALEIKAGALGRQAEKHPEDYPLHAAMLDKVVAGAAAGRPRSTPRTIPCTRRCWTRWSPARRPWSSPRTPPRSAASRPRRWRGAP